MQAEGRRFAIQADQWQAEGMRAALQGKVSPEGPCYFREATKHRAEDRPPGKGRSGIHSVLKTRRQRFERVIQQNQIQCWRRAASARQ
ncbi:hypothetical protein [Candidatus Methylomirabilis sp.]|uniref:hypothetical protein n=1 Tax=Candidatus Methylomirabilis sp. TaxID=2032687 RepID=UPI002A6357E4|nr:hypothetical protein [Candidatus Methylomirabilis sp.]